MARKTSILVVEDETLTAMCLREELTRMGFHVARCVPTGKEAVVAARDTQPDLILMDIRLAGEMDGIEAAKRIRKQAKIPIVFMTGYADREYRDRAMELAPVAYYVKPVNTAELARAIGSVHAGPPDQAAAPAPASAGKLNIFGHIAVWQFLTFLMLLMIVWVGELRDIASGLFGTQSNPVNIFRACFLSAGVLVTAIVAMGNTFLQQKRVLATLIAVCCKCRRVRMNSDYWARMEDYFADQSPMEFTHGLCPECLAEELQTVEERQRAKGR